MSFVTGTLFTSYTPRLVLGSSCSFFVGEGLLGLLEFLLLHGWAEHQGQSSVTETR